MIAVFLVYKTTINCIFMSWVITYHDANFTAIFLAAIAIWLQPL